MNESSEKWKGGMPYSQKADLYCDNYCQEDYIKSPLAKTLHDLLAKLQKEYNIDREKVLSNI